MHQEGLGSQSCRDFFDDEERNHAGMHAVKQGYSGSNVPIVHSLFDLWK